MEGINRNTDGRMVDGRQTDSVSSVQLIFCGVLLELLNLTEEKVEKGIADGTFVDYGWKGNQLSCTTLASIKQVTDKVRCATIDANNASLIFAGFSHKMAIPAQQTVGIV